VQTLRLDAPFAAFAVLLIGCARSDASDTCSHAWLEAVERQVGTGDGAGHGPDLGSEEWKSVVEFRLGLRGAEDVPPRDSDDWCRHIDRALAARPAVAEAPEAESAPGPSFDCAAVEPGSIAALVCADAGLAALDRKLAGVYAASLAKATNEHPPVLQAEQRGWIKGRDECWKSDDERECVRTEYRRRTAELNRDRARMLHEANDRHGGKPPVREILTALFAPPLKWLAPANDRRISLQFLIRARSEGTEKMREALRTDVSHLRRFSDALIAALSDLPAEEVYWRVHFVLGMIHQNRFAELDRLNVLSEGLTHEEDVDGLLKRMVDFAEAGFLR